MAESYVDLILKLKSKCHSMEASFFEKASITSADYNVINAFELDESLIASEFAQRLNVSVSRASRIITKMLNSGYIDAIPATDDRRKLMLSLSEKGKKIKKHINNMKEECEARIKSTLSQSQLEALASELETIIDIL